MKESKEGESLLKLRYESLRDSGPMKNKTVLWKLLLSPNFSLNFYQWLEPLQKTWVPLCFLTTRKFSPMDCQFQITLLEFASTWLSSERVVFYSFDSTISEGSDYAPFSLLSTHQLTRGSRGPNWQLKLIVWQVILQLKAQVSVKAFIVLKSLTSCDIQNFSRCLVYSCIKGSREFTRKCVFLVLDILGGICEMFCRHLLQKNVQILTIIHCLHRKSLRV